MTDSNFILVVDDDENDLRLTVTALRGQEGEGEIAVAHDGEQALNYLRCHGEFEARAHRNPCVVLLDLSMPRVNGMEVLREVKSDARLRTIPIVVFTSSPRENDVRESYQLGANAYLVKPLDYTQFKEAVRDLVSFWLRRNRPPPPPIATEALAAGAA